MQRRRQPASIREFYPAADVRAANAPLPHRALGEPVPHVAHGNDKRNVGLQHACERRGSPCRLVPYLTLADQASLYVIFSNIRNPIFPEDSATSDSGASILVVVAVASLLLLYASVYLLHHSSVRHIRRVSAPPVQNMCLPSPFPLFLAFLCVCVAVPTGAICALCRRSIVWAGICYGIKDGGVTSVVRLLVLFTAARCHSLQVRSDGSTRPYSDALQESKLLYASILKSK